MSQASRLEEQFTGLWLSYFPDVDLHSEYKFHPERRWRFDFACPISRVGVEIQGGIWSAGMGHNSGSGLIKDYEKFCGAASIGWLVFPLSENMLNHENLTLIAQTIEWRKQFTSNLKGLYEIQFKGRI